MDTATMEPSLADGAKPGSGLVVNGLCTGYGKQMAVREAALQVGSGEFVAIVGPNGAGKTSLIHALAGLLPVWRGSLTWNGNDLARRTAADRVKLGLSTVLQGAVAFPGMTIEQNLEVALGAAREGGAGPSRQSLGLVLELFPELLPKRRVAARTLSGGQRQMLSLARAMCQQPGLLLLDEPSFGLAIGVRRRVVEMLVEFRARTGCAVLMAEQDLEMISGAARVYFMSAGSLEAVSA